MKKLASALGILVLLSISLSFLPSIVIADKSGASNAISSARRQLVVCYSAAKKAEEAGANITGLTEVLNDSGLLLSRAELALANGDFSGAQEYAIQSQSRLANFVPEAKALLFPAGVQRSQDFLVNVAGSAIGTAAILVGSFALWSFLKKKYPSDGELQVGPAEV